MLAWRRRRGQSGEGRERERERGRHGVPCAGSPCSCDGARACTHGVCSPAVVTGKFPRRHSRAGKTHISDPVDERRPSGRVFPCQAAASRSVRREIVLPWNMYRCGSVSYGKVFFSEME